MKDRQKFAETKKWNPFMYDSDFFDAWLIFPNLNSTRVGNIARGVFQRNHFQKGLLGKFYSR